MILIQAHDEGCILAVRAQPGARRNALAGEQAEALKVVVTAPPDKGKANAAIAELLAERLGLRKSQVALHSGPTSRDKRFLVRGLSAAALQERLAALLA